MPQNLHIHAKTLGQLETDVLKKLWITVDEDGDGYPSPTAFSKYSQYRVRDKINEVYAKLCVFTKTIKSWFVVTLSANYHQYAVPQTCFDIERVYYFSSATAYTPLEVYDEPLIEDLLSPGWKTSPGTPLYAYVGDRNKMAIKLGIAPPPSVSGTAITLGSGVASRSAPFGVVEGVSGVASPTSGIEVYVDASGQNFATLGVIVGLTALNLSDGSKGVITSISTTNTSNDTLTCSGGFSGGSVNVWTPGDEMKIIGGEFGDFVEVGVVEAEYLLAPNIGQLPKPGLTMAAGNLLVQGYSYPILLRDKRQYPELSPVFHPVLATGAAALLAREEAADSPEFAQGQKYEEEFQSAVGLLSAHSTTQYKGNFNLWSRNS